MNSFSEFWFNNGGLNGITPLPINLVSFEAIKQNKSALLRWTTDNELNTSQFIVERSGDGVQFAGIGNVAALNSSGTNNYTLTDGHPFSGINFYRLKIMDRDGSFTYSPVRRVDFSSSSDDITVYPNPVTHHVLTIASTGNCTAASIYDAAGKLMKEFILKGRSNTLNLTGLVPGIYQLRILTENSAQTKKIMIQ